MEDKDGNLLDMIELTDDAQDEIETIQTQSAGSVIIDEE